MNNACSFVEVIANYALFLPTDMKPQYIHTIYVAVYYVYDSHYFMNEVPYVLEGA